MLYSNFVAGDDVFNHLDTTSIAMYFFFIRNQLLKQNITYLNFNDSKVLIVLAQ